MIKRLKLCLSAALLLMTSFVANAAEIDYTSKVSVEVNAWGGGDYTATKYAPAITTADGRTVQMVEVYDGGGVGKTGEMMSQTVTGLENGTYRVVLYANAFHANGVGGAATFTDGATDIAYVFAGNKQTPVVAYSTSSTSANGEYTLTDVEVTDGTLKLGFGKAKGGTNWHTIQIKSLALIVDESVVYNAAMEEAEAAIADGQYANVTGSERVALQAAINAEVDGTGAGYEAAADALTAATNAFKAAKDAYDKLVHENARCGSLGVAPVTIDAEMTAAKAVTAVQDLMVAEYNAVVAAYTVPIELGAWTPYGVVDFYGEHWDGTKTTGYKNQDDSEGQGWNANSWSASCSQVITLPEGEYVLRVAARRSDGAVVTLNVADGSTVLGTVDDFPVGNTGFGITTSGVASFDAADTYANNNNGFGWQWRYVPFTLVAETAVSISVEASASSLHQWASFGDYTVMAKPSVAAARKAYEVALAAAEEVRTAKMGAAELEALNAAIEATPVETVEWYEAATTALHNATNAATISIEGYTSMKAILDKCVNIPEYDAVAKFTCDEFQNNYNEGLFTNAEMATKISELRDEYRTYLRKISDAYRNANAFGTNIDLTTIGNPPTGWTCANGAGNKGTITVDNKDSNGQHNMFENYSWASGLLKGNMYTTVNNLPNGKYFLRAQAATTNAFDTDYIYIKSGDNEAHGALLNKVDDSHVTHKGNGAMISITKPIEVTNGTVELGLHVTDGTQWAHIGVVELKAYEIYDHPRASATGKLGTICLPYNATVDGAKLYTAAINGSYVTLTEHTGNVEAGVAYIYEATAAAQTFTWAKDADLIANPGDGDLKGVFSATKLTAGSYVMQTQNEVQKFFKVAAGEEPTLAAYRAYLPASASEVSAFNIAVGEATGINAVTGETLENAVIYNLNGQKLNRLQKGINIINGVKVIVK